MIEKRVVPNPFTEQQWRNFFAYAIHEFNKGSKALSSFVTELAGQSLQNSSLFNQKLRNPFLHFQEYIL